MTSAMYKRISEIILILFLVSCSRNGNKENNSSEDIIKINDTIRYDELKVLSKEMWLTAANQIEYCYGITRKNIDYVISVDSLNVVNYIQTSDTNFTLLDYKVGQRYSSLRDVDKNSGRYVSGWGYVINFKNGWNAVFVDSLVLRNRKIHDNSTLKFFYKKNN